MEPLSERPPLEASELHREAMECATEAELLKRKARRLTAPEFRALAALRVGPLSFREVTERARGEWYDIVYIGLAEWVDPVIGGTLRLTPRGAETLLCIIERYLSILLFPDALRQGLAEWKASGGPPLRQRRADSR